MFEIVGEINLELLNYDNDVELPVHVTIDMVKNKFLKESRIKIFFSLSVKNISKKALCSLTFTGPSGLERFKK